MDENSVRVEISQILGKLAILCKRMMWSKPLCSRRLDWEIVLEAWRQEFLRLERKKSGDGGMVLIFRVGTKFGEKMGWILNLLA